MNDRPVYRVVALLLALAVTSSAHGNEESDRLTGSAIEKLKAGQDVEALADVDAALAADSTDGKAHFVRGMLLNRLGDFPEAVASLSRANDLGYMHEHGLFEVGWAALGSGQPREAIVALQNYQEKFPDRAQTYEFLGRAYMQLGQYDRADALLAEAAQRDASLTPTVNIYRSLVARMRGDENASMTFVRSAIDQFPESPVSRAMSERLDAARVAALPKEKRWRLNLSTAIGYNDNVLTIDDIVPLPAGVGDRDGLFFRNTIHGAYDVVRDLEQVATIGYAFQADTFADDDFDSVDYTNHYWYAEYFRRIKGNLVAGLHFSDDYSRFDNAAFRNRINIRPSLGYRFNNVVSGELAYTLRVDEYFAQVIPVMDRDATGHLVEGKLNFDPPKLPLRTEFGLKYLVNAADGNDFDHDAITFYARAEFPIVWEILGEVTYAYTFSGYDNPNSLSFGTIDREDDTQLLRLQLVKPIPLHKDVQARVYLRYEYINNDSNLNAYEYDQNVVSVGIAVDF